MTGTAGLRSWTGNRQHVYHALLLDHQASGGAVRPQVAGKQMRTSSQSPADQLHSIARRRLAVEDRVADRSQQGWRRLWQWARDDAPMPSLSSHPLAREQRLQRLEAVLLLAREPLSSRKLSHYANLADGTEARTLVRRLNQLYDKAGQAFRVERVAGGFQLLTRPQFAGWLRRLEQIPAEIRLSAPAMETLAVVAYRQPVLRVEVEAIRGVNCGEILRQLMDRELVRISGRSEELGRPYLYGTTNQFLQVMGLSSLEDLPRGDLRRTDAKDAPEGNGSMTQEPQDQADDLEMRHQEKGQMQTMSHEAPPSAALALHAGTPSNPQNVEGDDEYEYEEEELDEYEDDEEDEFEDDEFEDDEDDEDDDELEDDDEDDLDEEEWEEVDDDDDEEEEDEEDWDDEDDEDDDWDEDEDEVEEDDYFEDKEDKEV